VSEPDLIALFIDPLNRTGIEYMVSGAVAAILYGESRLSAGRQLAELKG
jgi:hypothetical protein